MPCKKIEMVCCGYLFPGIEDTLNSLTDMECFSTLDLKNGYSLAEVSKENKELIVVSGENKFGVSR